MSRTVVEKQIQVLRASNEPLSSDFGVEESRKDLLVNAFEFANRTDSQPMCFSLRLNGR